MTEANALRRRFYKAKRGLSRGLAWPFGFLAEGPTKVAIRRRILMHQHSLPIEMFVNRGDTVVQIGTPWPRTIKRFVKHVGPEGIIVVVEAMPENQLRLQKAIDEMGWQNVKLVRAAATNVSGEGKLAISPFSGDHRIPSEIRMDNDLRPENAEMREIDVTFSRLDEALPAIGVNSFDALSITVNGAEAMVLEGAAELILKAPAWSRIYAKGHALDEEGEPIHKQSAAFMEKVGWKTIISKGEPSSTTDENWRQRAGDLFAWKTPTES